MPRPRIPDPLTIIYCIACRKPTNGRGYYGAGCMCGVDVSKPAPGPSVGTGTRR